MPAVSVVIPVFNADKWIGRTLDSVVKQTFHDYEIIVVDDGSTDRSAEVISQYPVKLIQQENAGHAAAYNTGLRATRGEYVAFLDADDLWAPEKLAYCVSTLRDDSAAVLCYTNGSAIDANDEHLWPLLAVGHRPPTPAELLLDCVICCPAQVVARRSAVGPFTEGLLSCDHDQWLQMREKGSFVYIDRQLTFYRRHSSQMSLGRRQWEDGFSILRCARRRYPYPWLTAVKRLAVLHYRLGEFDLRHGFRVRGLVHWAESAMLDPLRALGVAFNSRAELALALQIRHKRGRDDGVNDRSRQYKRAVLAASDDKEVQEDESQEPGVRCAEHERVTDRAGYRDS